MMSERATHEAQSRTQWRSHRRASDLLEDCSSNRELGHFQGHANDWLDVSNDDLAGDVQSTACSAFDDISNLVALRRFGRQDLIRLGTHGAREEVEHKVPALNEPVRVNTCEKAHQVLHGCRSKA